MAQDAVQGASDTLSSQLKFLSDAAHLMALTSPACSSHIMLRRDMIMFGHEMEPSEAHQRHACGGCGAIKIPAWTADVVKEKVNGSRKMTKAQLGKRKERATSSATPFAMVDICKRCHRKTRQSIVKPAPQRITSRNTTDARPSITKVASLAPTSSVLGSTSTASTTSASSSSKKRAKSRKQGGLQALLAKNKESSQGLKGFGLDLMDLMK